MDRPIEKKRWSSRKVAMLAAALAGTLGFAYLVMSSGATRLSTDADRLSAAQVKKGTFQEYAPITGTVQPMTTVYLDLEEGGIVSRIYVQGGNPVKRGDLILGFSNTNAQKQNIETETRLLENLNQLRNSKISLTQSGLILKDQLLDVENRIGELDRTFQRYTQLMQMPQAALSREQFETTRDQLQYNRDKRDLMKERIRQETILQRQQNVQVDESVRRVDRNLEILSRIVESLEVRAPIDGHLSTLNAEIGQNFERGQRIGQIDQLDSFKVRGEIDQYYITRLVTGQRGAFEFGGRRYTLEVVKIYPEVTDDRFQVDMTFVGPAPDGIKRGQRLQIDLTLSEPRQTQLVSKGSFYQYTNGQWAYLLAPDGRSARKTRIVLGRQNPQAVEVLEGLKQGDWIITSNYEGFNDVDELTFSQPIRR